MDGNEKRKREVQTLQKQGKQLQGTTRKIEYKRKGWGYRVAGKWLQMRKKGTE